MVWKFDEISYCILPHGFLIQLIMVVSTELLEVDLRFFILLPFYFFKNFSIPLIPLLFLFSLSSFPSFFLFFFYYFTSMTYAAMKFQIEIEIDLSVVV